MPSPNRSRTLLLALLALVSATATACSGDGPPTPHPAVSPVPRIALATVLAAVRKAPAIRTRPPGLTPSPATAGRDLGFDSNRCEVGPAADRIDACVFGDPAGSTKVVLYGDSHAGTWLPAMTAIAQRRHWQLRFFGKPACPAPRITVWSPPPARSFTECDRFRDFAAAQIAAEHPGLVVVTDESFGQQGNGGALVTPDEWRAGLVKTLTTLRRSAGQVVVLGDLPVLTESGPECLTAHARNVAACFTTRAVATGRVWNAADQAAARATGSGYIPVLPWLCTAICTPVIGDVLVYRNRFHLTATYSRRMSGVLEDALSKTFPAADVP